MRNADGSRRYRAMHFWVVNQTEHLSVCRRAHWYDANGSIRAKEGGGSTHWGVHAGLKLFPFMLPHMVARVSLKRLGPTEAPQPAGESGISYAVDAIAVKSGGGLAFGPLHGQDRRGNPSMADNVKEVEEGRRNGLKLNYDMNGVCQAHEDVWSLMWPDDERHATEDQWRIYRLGVKVYRFIWDRGKEYADNASRWPMWRSSPQVAGLRDIFKQAGSRHDMGRTPFAQRVREDAINSNTGEAHNHMLRGVDAVSLADRRLLV